MINTIITIIVIIMTITKIIIIMIITKMITRQSGGVGLALGMLNNPADADGNYNFKLVL